MKKLLLLGTIFIASVALAFGGSGKHRDRVHEWYGAGIDSLGVHYGSSCPKESSTTGQGGETGIYDGNVMCKCTDANKVYTVNGCEVQPEVCDDHTINQCGLGYYCQFSPVGCESRNRGDGVCTQITGGTEVIPVGDTTKIYLMGARIDWWSANSWCVGNGKHLVTSPIVGHPLDDSYLNDRGNGDIYTYFGQDVDFWTVYDDGESPCCAWAVYADFHLDNIYLLCRSYGSYALCE